MTITSAKTRQWFHSLRHNFHIAPGAVIWIAIVGLLVLVSIVAPEFLQFSHLLNVTRQASILGIIAIGQTLVLITGGLDMSNGMVISLVNVVAATLLRGEDTLIVPVVALCLAIGTLVGLANGLVITKLKVPPLVATLGMFIILKGTAFVYTDGAPKGDVPPSLMFVGSGFIGPFPTAIFFWIIFTGLGIILLRRTVFGRYLFAVGGNEVASRLSGVRTDRVVITAYVISGVLAAVAGLILSGYIGTGSLGAGDDRNLDSLAAAVVGGTPFTGGVGTIIGTAGGALFLSILASLLRFLGLPYSSQLMVQGVILIIAIYAHVHARR